jgi:hypothetical protein
MFYAVNQKQIWRWRRNELLPDVMMNALVQEQSARSALAELRAV